jgi:N-acetylglucosamine-6-phosphate deacetylase
MEPITDKFALVGGDVVTPLELFERGTVLVERGYIRYVGSSAIDIPPDYRRIEASGHWITPGLIDVHTHGLLGFDNFGSSLADAIPHYPEHGVTGFLATTMTAPPDVTMRNLAAMAKVLADPPAGASCLGIHLEGPFLSPQQAGAANPDWLRAFDWDEFHQMQQAAGGWIKRITLAPELLPDLAAIEALQAEGVVVSAGHSDATFEQMNLAIGAGLSCASHLYNAMRRFHHREPGPLPALLLDEGLFAEVIGDGQHVHPAALALLLKAKGSDRVILVSDSAPPAGLPDGEYSWGGQQLTVQSGRCQLEDGTLAGSYWGLDQGLRTMTQQLQLPITSALAAACLNPARSLQIKEIGCLAAGMAADLVWFDRKFQPSLTMIRGQPIWWSEDKAKLLSSLLEP